LRIEKQAFEGVDKLEAVNYKFNIKGWLTNISTSGNLFTMGLYYDKQVEDYNQPRYNGNISYIKWQTIVPPGNNNTELRGEKGYDLRYDKLNRLAFADFYDDTEGRFGLTTTYREYPLYDLNGNITRLTRMGKNIADGKDAIDDLDYYYNGNQVIAIDDRIMFPNVDDFYDNGHYFSQTENSEYRYDDNGNMTSDLNKEILEIRYNEQNLPIEIIKDQNNRIEYLYDALGNKKRQIAYSFDGQHTNMKTTDFIGNFVYVDGIPAWNNFDEGRVVYPPAGAYFYENYIKDHLGSVRVTYSKSGTTTNVRDVFSYYPFGMTINSLTATAVTARETRNEYLYNGKMFQDELGLNWLDYGARFYDAVVGRFHTIDPFSEENSKQSPFVYADNNPIYFIDIMGMNADGYLMDEYGKIDAKPANNEGGKKFDVIYNKNQYTEEKKKDYDVSGNKTGIIVNKQVLESHTKTTVVMTDSGGTKTGEIKTIDKYETKNASEAHLLMNFIDKNTNVEWSNTTLSQNVENINVLITSHESGVVTYSTKKIFDYIYAGYTLIKDDHIHPEQYSSNPLPSDIERKNSLSPNSDAIFRILYKGKYSKPY